MARHHAFWVILSGTVPTAFRSPRREDLLPTLHQLQRTQSDVTLQWFDRGKLWESPEAARAALLAKRRQFSDRKADWRPGGAHRDPRARYELSRDEKRARFKKRLGRPPFNSRPAGTGGAGTPGEGQPGPKPFGKRPFRPAGNRSGRPPSGGGKPFGQRPPGKFARKFRPPRGPRGRKPPR